MRNRTGTLVLGFLLNLLIVGEAFADDYGCQVALCLADPRGPTTEAECRRPIKRLWRDLSLGKPFPVCQMAGAGNSNNNAQASQTPVGPANCPPQYFVLTGVNQTAKMCQFTSAVTINVGGTPYATIWIGPNGSITQALTDQAQGSPGASQYNADLSAWKQAQASQKPAW